MEQAASNRILPRFLDDQVRDLILILPGGGYEFTSPREAEPIVRAFHAAGHHAAIFEYRHVKHPYPALLDEAIVMIAPLRADPRIRRLLVCGFSAGGHFAGLLWTAKPEWFAGAILCYPVITADVMTRHDGSIRMLVGDHPTAAQLDAIAIEKRVTTGLSPVFLWHTQDDASVPVENALVLMQALRLHHIPFEAHIFQNGPHGLSLANRETPWNDADPLRYEEDYKAVAAWFPLCREWLRNLPGNVRSDHE